MFQSVVLVATVLLVSYTRHPKTKWIPPLSLQALGLGQDIVEETTTTTDSELTTMTMTTSFDTSTGTTPLEEMFTFPPFVDDPDGETPQMIPFGVLLPDDGAKPKKRCRCIEKKRRKVVKVVKYIPLSPGIQLETIGGHKRNFTCKCSHLRKIVKH